MRPATTPHLSRRKLLTCLGAYAAAGGGLSACETLDPAILEGVLGGAGGAGLISQAEAAQGIRAALNNGIGQAVGTVGKSGGFSANDIIRIPLPRKLAEIQSTLSRFGASGLLDDLALQLNRGAELAAPVAKDIFFEAVGNLSIADAIGIVRGPNNAATQYLQGQTTQSLTGLFTPIMENALGQTGALSLLETLDRQTSALGVSGIGASAKNDLVQHGVEYGLSGVFHYIGEEERLIRENPAKRTSEILRRVFGAYAS